MRIAVAVSSSMTVNAAVGRRIAYWPVFDATSENALDRVRRGFLPDAKGEDPHVRIARASGQFHRPGRIRGHGVDGLGGCRRRSLLIVVPGEISLITPARNRGKWHELKLRRDLLRDPRLGLKFHRLPEVTQPHRQQPHQPHQRETHQTHRKGHFDKAESGGRFHLLINIISRNTDAREFSRGRGV